MPDLDPQVLVQLRIKMGLSQSDLASKLGLDRKTVLRWEQTGKIKKSNMATLVHLAEEKAPPPKPTPAWPPPEPDPNETFDARRKRDPWAPLTPADKAYLDAWTAGLPIPEWLRD